ncbi:MAG: cytochrome c biogenesis protein ResB [Planctomycetes bacterium]|nr:cytochrome c biogenesis protein ResB [Planctomycetota bacterium]MCP4770819.1 cytochrome c biogenesis protein ResB [Planctomycetota bacterium]MCP4861359.1 cytochrome c biogenesis protein ResB [Planctomycetota bacterium]
MSTQSKSPGRHVFDVLSSFWLCCLLLLALFVLTIYGTLHQVENGLYDAKQVYFHSWFLWLGSVPIFPGGLLCMSLLSVNLLCGGFIRIKWHSRNFGVLIVHIGIVLLLGSGLTKIITAEEGHLSVVEGSSQDFFESYQLWEVAIWELNNRDATQELVIENDSFSDLDGEASRTFTSESLPFDLVLSGFVPNCQVLPVGPNWSRTGKAVEGYGFLAKPKDLESERNDAGIYASVTADGVTHEALLWGLQRQPWAIQVGDRAFAIDMRHARYPMPFSIRLEDFIKEEHPGMSMAKSYRSKVVQVSPTGSERPVLIQMNEPLRDGGVVLFQSSFGKTQSNAEYSVFSVVRNPSDKWPEYSMWVITVGMVVAFGRRLISFVRTQSKRRQRAAGASQ